MPQVDSGRYLHGHHESVLRSHRWRTAANSAAFLLPHLKPGQGLLDVGCGPGTLTADLARSVAPGEVIGIDLGGDVIELASSQKDLPENVRFAIGDLFHLDFPDERFAVVHAHQVLQHLDRPVAALAEMRRVCAPGGLVAVREGDFGSMLHYPADPLLDQWWSLYREVARATGGEPFAGRQLLSWAQEVGFSEINSSASAWCFATEVDRQWWGSLWADRITQSEMADRIISLDLGHPELLEEFAQAWRRWARDPAGWFAMLHGEIICRP